MTTTTDNNLPSFFARRWPTKVAFWLGRHLPPALGYLVARIIAQVIVWLKPPIYHGALANMAHVLPEMSEQQRRRRVRRLIFNAGRCYYDFFHNVSQPEIDPQAFSPPVRIAPEVRAGIAAAAESGRGLLILGTHTSNFDLAGITLASHLPAPPQVLSIASPAPGFEFINRLREQGRGELTPISAETLRTAIQRLRQGGIVMTAVDRPVPGTNDPVTFFDATACLPTGYMRIPLLTDCLVMTVSFAYREGAYWVLGYPPLDIVRTGDRRRDVEVNLQRVLAQVEALIRQVPDEWMVFTPVWPNGDNACGT